MCLCHCKNAYICEDMARYIFNPEHDLCLADGGEDYIPPASAVEFREQCGWIERFIGVPGREVGIVPWGWNRSLRKRLLQEGIPKELLPDDTSLSLIRLNSRREVAVELLERLAGGLPESAGIISPGYRIVARSIQEIEAFVAERGKVVLKAPLSGSGKGIRFVAGALTESDSGWCRRVLERQGSVIAEVRLQVVQEFAMLFEYGDDVRFRGYSCFYASNGAYKGNLLASDRHIAGLLGRWVPEGVLEEVRCRVEGFLRERLQGWGRLKGFAGVDQFVCAGGRDGEFLYNPAVELNFRMTMGHIARNIYDFYPEEFGLGEGTHCLEPLKGVFPCGEGDAKKQ